MDWQMILLDLWTKVWPLLLVIGLDLIFGVVKSLKDRKFEWEKLAGFLETYGIKLFGWLVLEALTFLPEDVVAETAALNLGTTALSWTAYIAVMGSALGSLYGNVVAVGLIPDVIQGVAAKVGFPRKEVG